MAVEVLDLTDFAKSGFVCALIIHEKSLQVTIAFFGTSKKPLKSLIDSNFCQSSSVVEQRTHNSIY